MQTYILFQVAGTSYAVESQHVRHMEMVDQVTAVPNAEPFVEGVVFSRGHVVPVVNLRVRFGFERAARDLRSRLLVVDLAGRLVGLLADEAREFVGIASDTIQPPQGTLNGVSGDYLEGVATIGERIVLIVNPDRIVSFATGAAA